jgi:transposase
MSPQREAQLLEQLRLKDEENARLRMQIKLLEQKIDLLVKRVFGASSEKLDAAQLQLLLAMEEPGGPKSEASGAELEAVPQKRRPAGPRERKERLPEHLPMVEVVLDPPEVSAEPQAWRCIGEEVSEQLDYEPARFLRRRLVRRKWVKRAEAHLPPVIAPLPPVLQERCVAAPGLLAQIITAKYCDHLPLYRQEQIYRQRHGVDIPRQTMVRWLAMAAQWCELVYQEIRTGVMGGGYVQIDETPIRYLSPGNGKCELGYLWTARRPGTGVFYQWHASRAATCLERLVPREFAGTVQSDGYAAYPAMARQREGRIKLAACWAHVRRKFFEAKEQAPVRAGWLLRQMQHLYAVERRLREEKAGPALRDAMRASESKPIVERIGRALRMMQQRGGYLPKSSMGRAIAYALEQWPALQVYLKEGRVEIDNNLVENAIRPTALGKKNWLFIGHEGAGQNAAVLYTLVENCRLHHLDPQAYLRALLTALPTMTTGQVPDWTPAAWARRNRSSLPVVALAS